MGEHDSTWREQINTSVLPSKLGATAEGMKDTTADDPEKPESVQAVPQCSGDPCALIGYFSLSFVTFAFVSALSIYLWSSQGIGEESLQFLEDHYEWRYTVAFLCFVLLLVLYLLDFFWPPETKDKETKEKRSMFSLWAGRSGEVVGRALFSVAFFCFLAGVFLSTKDMFSIPMIVMVLVQQLSVFFVYFVSLPFRKSAKVGIQDDPSASHHFQNVIAGTKSQSLGDAAATDEHFYEGVIAGSVVTVVLCLVAFGLGDHIDDVPNTTKEFSMWATPLVMAIGNSVVCIFTVFRMYVHRALLRGISTQAPDESMASTETFRAEERQFILYVKLIGCTIVLMIGFLYVACQFAYADGDMGTTFAGIAGIFFVTFLLMVYTASRRLAGRFRDWIATMPLWKAMGVVMHWDITHACLVCCFLPLVPFALVLSFLNEFVRKCRGTYDEGDVKQGWSSPQGGSNSDLGANQSSKYDCFTPRFRKDLLARVAQWDWDAVASKTYFLCFLYLGYALCPPILNVCLAEMRFQLQEVSFEAVLVMVFIIGLTAFLLPPVPGITVYIFGGLVVSGQCPIGGKGTDTAFWVGSFINIVVCFFLKLAACAVQQVCIGGMLGRSLWVRQTVGIHKVFFRCIEAELSAPGWTVGKVAILCGAPDWPVSVLAGVLGLSLFQCELGTIPIIFFVIPCALSGSLYLKMESGVRWARLAKLMLLTSFAVSIFLWALGFWAIQNRLQQHFTELNKKKKEHVDLEWLDVKNLYLEREVEQKRNQVHSCQRNLYVLGSLCQVLLMQLMYWIPSLLFGSFSVEQNIAEFEGVVVAESTDAGILTHAGVYAMFFYSFTSLLYAQFELTIWLMSRRHVARVASKLNKVETSWKEHYQLRCEGKDAFDEGYTVEYFFQESAVEKEVADKIYNEAKKQVSVGISNGSMPWAIYMVGPSCDQKRAVRGQLMKDVVSSQACVVIDCHDIYLDLMKRDADGTEGGKDSGEGMAATASSVEKRRAFPELHERQNKVTAGRISEKVARMCIDAKMPFIFDARWLNRYWAKKEFKALGSADYRVCVINCANENEGSDLGECWWELWSENEKGIALSPFKISVQEDQLVLEDTVADKIRNCLTLQKEVDTARSADNSSATVSTAPDATLDVGRASPLQEACSTVPGSIGTDQ